MPEPDQEPLYHPVIAQAVATANECGLEIQHRETHAISVWTSRYTGLHIRLWIDAEEMIAFNFYCRTTSWQYNGERTDLHDSLSVFFAVFLKQLELCSIFTVPVQNPATEAEAEIYGNYLIPVQVDPGLINAKAADLGKIDILISALFIFEQFLWNQYGGCPCDECRSRLDYEFDYRWEDMDSRRLNQAKNILGYNEMLVSYIERTLPTWFYYRNFKTRATLIDSPAIMPFFHAKPASSVKPVKGLSGDLMIGKHFQHYLSNVSRKKLYAYFRKLKDKQPELVILENKLIAVGERFIVSIDTDCGLHRFKKEREKVRERHNAEFELLFSQQTLVWADRIQDDLFENLIKDLLEREPNVSRVRKLAHTRERDKGADLIAEWIIAKDRVAPGENPYVTINVIIQCKAYKNGVGKSDVPDIRDTVEHRNYDGFFLATSSYTKASLSEHLDKLRIKKQLWVDWWTSAEIEERLKKHEDLILKYSSILSFQLLA